MLTETKPTENREDDDQRYVSQYIYIYICNGITDSMMTYAVPLDKDQAAVLQYGKMAQPKYT